LFRNSHHPNKKVQKALFVALSVFSSEQLNAFYLPGCWKVQYR